MSNKQALMATSSLVRPDAEEEDKRDDADAGTMLKTVINDMSKIADAVQAMQDSFGKRMDAQEKTVADACARMDAMNAKPDEDEDKDDKKKPDEDEDKDDKKKPDEDEDKDKGKPEGTAADEDDKDEKKPDAHADADPAKLLAEISKLRGEIGDLRALTPAPMSDSTADELLAIQARADSTYTELGKRAPGPMVNEQPQTYRRRLLKDLLEFSPSLKDANLYAINDSAAFGAIENQVYADAQAFARSPVSVPTGRLRPVSRKSDSGHTITEYHGESSAWMQRLAGPVTQHVTQFGDE